MFNAAGVLARRMVLVTVLTLTLVASARAQTDPLPSWNEGATKAAIVDFVGRVTRTASPTGCRPSPT